MSKTAEEIKELAKEFYPPITTDLICSPQLVRDGYFKGYTQCQINTSQQLAEKEKEIEELKTELDDFRSGCVSDLKEIQSLKEEVEGLKDKYNKLFYETPQDFIKANIELKNENESLQSELDEVKGEKEDFKLALEQIRTSCNPEESSHELFWHISQGVLTKYTNSEEGKEVKDV